MGYFSDLWYLVYRGRDMRFGKFFLSFISNCRVGILDGYWRWGFIRRYKIVTGVINCKKNNNNNKKWV